MDIQTSLNSNMHTAMAHYSMLYSYTEPTKQLIAI